MARRLLEAGFPLVVWNRTPERTAQLAAGGARIVQQPRELAEAASIVVTMLADADALGAVLEGEDGLIAGLSTDSILIDMSTIGPKAARRFAAATAERGAHWIDAPVSGSTALAESGGLAMMLGGDREVVARAEPVLEVLGAKRFHLGGTGAGAAMKLAVNG